MKIKASEQGKLKGNPIFKGMDNKLKDPKMFKKIENSLKLMMVSNHKHTNVKTFLKCPKCADKVKAKADAIRDYGFKDYAQYMEWRRIMTIITNKKDFQVG